jgi:hypothetical protein
MKALPRRELLAADRTLLHGVEALEEVADLALQGQDADQDDAEDALPVM